eukprot:3178510-Lingulodinium_polyedra.AAC.2
MRVATWGSIGPADANADFNCSDKHKRRHRQRQIPCMRALLFTGWLVCLAAVLVGSWVIVLVPCQGRDACGVGGWVCLFLAKEGMHKGRDAQRVGGGTWLCLVKGGMHEG